MSDDNSLLYLSIYLVILILFFFLNFNFNFFSFLNYFFLHRLRGDGVEIRRKKAFVRDSEE